MNDRTIIVPAQAGLWLVMLSPGPAADEPWELVEQPLIAWDLSSVIYDIGAVPIGVLVKAWPVISGRSNIRMGFTGFLILTLARPILRNRYWRN